jgi:transposase
MSKIRKTHSKDLKFKAALAMIKGDKTLSQLSTEYGVAQSVLHRWKQTLQQEGPTLFEDQRKGQMCKDQSSDLERKIGQLVMENDFLKKALGQ